MFRKKNAWMYKDERKFLEDKASQMVLPTIEQQCELPVKPLEVSRLERLKKELDISSSQTST